MIFSFISPKNIFKKVLVIFLFIVNSRSDDLSINGYVNYSYISRLSNGALINIPYRIASLNLKKESNSISINGNFSFEYHLRDDSYFLSSNDPQDFTIDMRELYLTYIDKNLEFRIGKQMHSWGNVDDNSPLDNGSALDYYYMFYGGLERKMSTFSLALDYYLRNFKLNFLFSPLHATNRIPLGNDDFPISLPIYPNSNEIFPISKRPYEGGAQITLSSSIGDITTSYFSGYDRTFNLTGVNVYGHGSDISFPKVDIVYGYRRTNVFGLGGTFLNDFFTLRFDAGYFLTSDKNETISRPSSFNPVYYDSLHFTYPLLEESNYWQSTIQMETELPFGINLIAQYFMHDTINYSSKSLPVDQEISIPNLDLDPEDITPSNFFTPGMGVPVAILTSKAIFLTLDKFYHNNKLKLSITSMIDGENYEKVGPLSGSLVEFGFAYDLEQDLKILLAITNVRGNKNHPQGIDYTFNDMEDFSHFRFELKYFF